MKKGFGLLEVIVAAVVLGFLIVGLNKLQSGNREAVLRVRARDAANFIAQHVLDSLGSVGLNSIKLLESQPESYSNLVYYDADYAYTFEGNKSVIKQDIPYKIAVALIPSEDDSKFTTTDTTRFTNVNSADQLTSSTNPPVENTFAKNLQATVSWKFKESWQSITMAKVVR